MTEIEKKALVQAVAAAGRRMHDYNIMAEENPLRQSIEAHARAIEHHEAFRQEVSEFALGVKGYMASVKALAWQDDCDCFIIAKPDPLVDAMNESLDRLGAFDAEEANNLRAALAKRGLQVTDIER